MAMIVSKLTSKARTTIPHEVREALGLRNGDQIAYAVERDRVVITKACEMQTGSPLATFDEWGSAADCKAYRGL